MKVKLQKSKSKVSAFRNFPGCWNCGLGLGWTRSSFLYWQVLRPTCWVLRSEWYFQHGVSCAKVWKPVTSLERRTLSTAYLPIGHPSFVSRSGPLSSSPLVPLIPTVLLTSLPAPQELMINDGWRKV